MPKPSIGTAQIPVPEKEEKPVIQELTVLEEGSKESIYNLIFLKKKNKINKGRFRASAHPTLHCKR